MILSRVEFTARFRTQLEVILRADQPSRRITDTPEQNRSTPSIVGASVNLNNKMRNADRHRYGLPMDPCGGRPAELSFMATQHRPDAGLVS
jgi:hypothetical protein